TCGGGGTANKCGGGTSPGTFDISSPLTITPSSLGQGQTVTGKVVYTNGTASAVIIDALVIAIRPPGGTHASGPYDDAAPELGSMTIEPGATATLTATRTIGATDPTGTWDAYATYQDSAGGWHDGPDVYFTVGSSVTP